MSHLKSDVDKLIMETKDHEEKELLKIYPEVLKTLMNELHTVDNDLDDAQEHFQTLFNYMVLEENRKDALMIVRSYREMVRDASEQDLKVIRIIGWCAELFNASFRLFNEILFDQAVNGKGRPCYHRISNRGDELVNDAYYLLNAVYTVLRVHIKDKRKFVVVEPMFRKATKQKVIGQHVLQETHFPRGETDFSTFTFERYDHYANYRNAYPHYVQSVKQAMFWAGVTDHQGVKQAEAVVLKLGYFAQVKDDFLNCYGNKEVFAKAGSNIAWNKMCWLIVTALGKVDGRQKEIIKANYGQPDQACIDKVKAVYDELGLKDVFRNYEKKVHKELTTEISGLSDDLPKKTLMDVANHILRWEDTLFY